MEPQRDEVYERIPWETLEKKGGDRQWLVYAVAGAVALGALAFSFIRNQPVAVAPTAMAPITTVAASAVAPVEVVPAPLPAPVSTVSEPLVVSEADLYAVEPERLVDRVTAHAEWLAVEFVAHDGSEQSRETLASLLPAETSLPETPEGTQVFVDWASVTEVTRTSPVGYVVEVLVRSLVSTDGSAFSRQPPQIVIVEVALDETGEPVIAAVPVSGPVTIGQLGTDGAILPLTLGK